jgi:3-phenylpropionate/trans-cinnamate dioxygenase ferredoxin component
MAWIAAAPVSTVRAAGMLETVAGDAALLLIDLAGTIHAVAAVWPHHQAWLSMGRVEGDCIDCPRHHGRFHIPTGEQRRGPASPPLPTYPVMVESGQILVLLPD